MEYPKRFKNKHSGMIVDFTSLYQGKLVYTGNYPIISTLDNITTTTAHTDTSTWEEVIVTPSELDTLKAQVLEMQETIKRMEAEKYEVPLPKIVKWEPTGRGYYVNGLGSICTYTNSHNKRIAFGTVYTTKSQAEWAAKQMRSFNRLLCYVAEHTTGVSEDISIHPYHLGKGIIVSIPTLPYFSREVLAERIKTGEVVL